jgi:hypothetical protein
MNRLPLVLLAALVVAFRLLGAAFPDTIPNFSPLAALLLCSLVFLKGTWRWALPLGVWVVTDPLVSAFQGYPVVGWHWAALPLGIAATVAIAVPLRRNPRALPMLAGAAGAALAFYFLTNAVSFLALPLYPKSPLGFVQAEWTGPVGFGPTWVFLRNALTSNLLFTGLALLAHRGFQPVAAPVRAKAIRGV